MVLRSEARGILHGHYVMAQLCKPISYADEVAWQRNSAPGRICGTSFYNRWSGFDSYVWLRQSLKPAKHDWCEGSRTNRAAAAFSQLELWRL